MDKKKIYHCPGFKEVLGRISSLVALLWSGVVLILGINRIGFNIEFKEISTKFSMM
jgi:hypothetical protein